MSAPAILVSIAFCAAALYAGRELALLARAFWGRR